MAVVPLFVLWLLLLLIQRKQQNSWSSNTPKAAPKAICVTNIGTTLSALLASLVSNSVLSLQVALAHLMFNVTGTLIWYPLPFMRAIPLGIARRLGKATRVWRGFPFLYIAVTFFLAPVTILGVSLLFTQNSKGWMVLGIFVVLTIVLGLAYFGYWYKFQGGASSCNDGYVKREARRSAMRSLPDDMDYLKRNMRIVLDQLGLSDEADDDDDDEEPMEEPMEESPETATNTTNEPAKLYRYPTREDDEEDMDLEDEERA
jgi:solute carrier family 34 (sodium-dependent phosphate cotransporter)